MFGRQACLPVGRLKYFGSRATPLLFLLKKPKQTKSFREGRPALKRGGLSLFFHPLLRVWEAYFAWIIFFVAESVAVSSL
jgi:hypothetical protein